MEIPIHLTERAVRLLKSYAMLTGKDIDEISSDLKEIFSITLEKELAPRIAAELAITEKPHEDTTGISEGLGDLEPEEPEGVEEEDALVPEEGGVTDSDLEKDMEVDNPETEVKAEAPTAEVGDTSLFAEVAGFDQWDEKRKTPKSKVGKGKVTPMFVDTAEETTI